MNASSLTFVVHHFAPSISTLIYVYTRRPPGQAVVSHRRLPLPPLHVLVLARLVKVRHSHCSPIFTQVYQLTISRIHWRKLYIVATVVRASELPPARVTVLPVGLSDSA